MQVRSLGLDVPLEKEMATHSGILAWKVPRTEEVAGYSPKGCKEWRDWAHTHDDSSHSDLHFDKGCLLKNSNSFKIASWKIQHSSEILLVQCLSFSGKTEVLKRLWDQPGSFLADPGLPPRIPDPIQTCQTSHLCPILGGHWRGGEVTER